MLKRTELRRRLLVAVDVGSVMYHPPITHKDRGKWRVHDEPATFSESRTLGDLQAEGLIRRPIKESMFHPRRVVLTADGVKLLVQWQEGVRAS